MSAFSKFACFLQYLILTPLWNEPPYLKGWRLDISLVYSNNIFESDANITRLNKALYVNGHMSINQEIKESWGWTGIEPEEVVGENDFGNLMIRDTSGKYWRLCPEDVYCEVVAGNREELDSLNANQEFLQDWNMQSLVEKARDELGPLEQGRKYHLIIPGVLGGEYDVPNIRTVALLEQIRFSGDVGKQIRELPDGSQIQLMVIP